MYKNRTRTPGTTLATLVLASTLALAGLGAFGPSALADDPADPADVAGEAADEPAEDTESPESTEPAEDDEAVKVEPVVTCTGLGVHLTTNVPEYDVNRTALPTIGVDLALTNEVEMASELLEAINALRAEHDIPALGNDPILEASAYQRAAESVLLNANIRPDGTLFDTVGIAISGYDIIFSEILVTGNPEAELDAAAVLQMLQDSEESWMLINHGDGGLLTAGVGCVKDAAGNTYWAVLFSVGGAPLDYVPTPVEDGDATYKVQVSSAHLAIAHYGCDFSVEVGTTKAIPMPANIAGELACGMQTVAFTPSLVNLSASDYTWNTSNPDIATAENGVATGVAAGTCILSAANADNMQFIYNATVGDGKAHDLYDLADCTVAGIMGSYVDTGEPQTPAFSVIDPEDAEVAPSNYTYEFTNNAAPGTATLTITAVEGSKAVTGSLVKTFTITAVQTLVPSVAGMYPDAAASAVEAAGLIPYLAEGEAAEAAEATGIVYATKPVGEKRVDVGSRVTIYYYAAPVATTDEPAPGDDDSDDGQDEPVGEDEGAPEPGDEPAPDGDDSSDPDASGDDPQEASEEPLEPAANEDDPQPVDPDLVDLAGAGFSIAAIDPMVLGDSPCEPTVYVLSGSNALIQGTDYTVSYENNSAPGTATVIATGTGAYGGTLSLNFQVLGDLAAAGSITALFDQPYTGGELTPEPVVHYGDTQLVEGEDYTLAYANNVDASTAENPATVTVTGCGNYTGSFDAPFAILPFSIKGLASVAPIPSVTYTGFDATPGVVVTLGDLVLRGGIDYTVAYENNVAAGTAHVIVKGAGNYCDSVDTTFVIAPANIAAATVVMPNEPYSGQALSPVPVSVTVGDTALQLGVDYTVVGYAGNVEPGNATAEIRGMGNWAGTVFADWKVLSPSSDAAAQSATTETLPATGDSTNLVYVAIAAVVGVALVIAALVIIVSVTRASRNNQQRVPYDYDSEFDEYR